MTNRIFFVVRGEFIPFTLNPVEPTSIALQSTNSMSSQTLPLAQIKNIPLTVGADFLESWITTLWTLIWLAWIISHPRLVILRS